MHAMVHAPALLSAPAMCDAGCSAPHLLAPHGAWQATQTSPIEVHTFSRSPLAHDGFLAGLVASAIAKALERDEIEVNHRRISRPPHWIPEQPPRHIHPVLAETAGRRQDEACKILATETT
jgi:hypothetical protein